MGNSLMTQSLFVRKNDATLDPITINLAIYLYTFTSPPPDPLPGSTLGLNRARVAGAGKVMISLLFVNEGNHDFMIWIMILGPVH